jgi:chaperonin GroEL
MKVATIASNGEVEVASLIVAAIKASGVDGEVIVEEAKGFKSSLEVVDGYQVERGFLSPYFITDKDKSICDFKDPLVLMSDNAYTSIQSLMKPLEVALDMNKPVLIIANDVDGDALQGLVLNKVKGSLRVSAIKSPGFGATRHDLLGDMQTILGGKVLDASFDMNDFDVSMFGTCKRAIIQKTSTLFIVEENKRTNESLTRIASIKESLAEPGLSSNERELYQYRLRQLSGAISILRVGAATEAELIERYDRVDDALNATKAAIQEGILPGGGVALVRVSRDIAIAQQAVENDAVRAGMSILMSACLQPFRQIIINGGKDPASYLDKIEESDINVGLDFRNDKFGDMFELGIVDPFKVTRCALENSVSAATALLSIGSAMIEQNITSS